MDVMAQVAATEQLFMTAGAGLVVLDAQNRLVYHNQEALKIISYPELGSRKAATDSLSRILQNLSHFDKASTLAASWHFKSGRRRYTCRWFRLTQHHGNGTRPTTGILLERAAPRFLDLSVAVRQFGLTRREQETVELLTLGLTSKEIASRMNISPNTVKVFFRLVMTKMAVNTRSGIVGKIARMQSVA